MLPFRRGEGQRFLLAAFALIESIAFPAVARFIRAVISITRSVILETVSPGTEAA